MSPTPKKNAEIMQHKAQGLAGELAGDLVLPEKQLTLAAWASRYMQAEVIGIQSLNTQKAKKRDLSSFLTWFFDENGHLDITDWLPRDTQGFLTHLEEQGRAATTVNRYLATLRRFARWVHDQDKSPFVGGVPTNGIKELITDEPTAKKLDTREVNRLFKAADRLVLTEMRKNARPRRDRAALGLLYYAGLRVSELCALKVEQYDGVHLIDFRRKGKARTKQLYLNKQCRAYLDDYLENERPLDDPQGARDWLVLAFGASGRISRHTIWRALVRLANSATGDFKVHPHRLRHTFGFEVRKRTGSDTETAALLGHSGLKYVGRYVRNTEAERQAVLEDL